jgi:NADH-quinone oxidoreductase subunit G
VRGDNRDKSGINGDFLCNKGRYAFDFANSRKRITQPLVRQPNGELKAVSWEEALTCVGKKFAELHDTRGGRSFGVIGGNSPDQRRGLPVAEVRALRAAHQQHRPPPHGGLRCLRAIAGGTTGRAASLRDTLTAKAVLLVGGDPTNQSPATAWNLRSNVRHNGARIYIANTAEIKLRRQAKAFLQVAEYGYGALAAYLAGDDSASDTATADSAALAGFRDAVRSEESLLS